MEGISDQQWHHESWEQARQQYQEELLNFEAFSGNEDEIELQQIESSLDIQEKFHDFDSLVKYQVHLPIEIEVILFGFLGDGGYGYYLDPQKFEEELNSLEYSFCPGVYMKRKFSKICHTFHFKVISFQNVIQQYEYVLKSLIKPDKAFVRQDIYFGTNPAAQVFKGTQGTRNVIHGEILETFFEQLIEQIFQKRSGHKDDKEWHRNNVILLLNPDKRNLVEHPPQTPLNLTDKLLKTGEVSLQDLKEQEQGMVYAYKYNGVGSNQGFMGKGSYFVIDVASGPVSIGPSTVSEGISQVMQIPRIVDQMMKYVTSENTNVVGDRRNVVDNSYKGVLQSVVTQAAQHIFGQDYYHDNNYANSVITVPIFGLRNHDEFHLLDTTQYSKMVDTELIQNEIQKLVPPNTKIEVYMHQFNIHHYPDIAISFQKAIKQAQGVGVMESEFQWRKLATKERTVVNSQALLQDLKENPSSILAQYKNEYIAHGNYYKRNDVSQKFLVLPVIIFSMQDEAYNLLFDNGDIVASDEDTVVVLQPIRRGIKDPHFFQAESDYFCDGQFQYYDFKDLNRYILSGLGSTIGGVIPPYQQLEQNHLYSQIIQDPDSDQLHDNLRLVSNFAYQLGHHPYGPFSNTSEFSDIFINSAQRRTLASRLQYSIENIGQVKESFEELTGNHLKAVHETNYSNVKTGHLQETWVDQLLSQSYVDEAEESIQALYRINDQLQKANQQLSSIVRLLYYQKFADAEQEMDVLADQSWAYRNNAQQVFFRIRQKLECCKLTYTQKGKMKGVFSHRNLWLYFVIMLVAIVVVGGILARNLDFKIQMRRRKAKVFDL